MRNSSGVPPATSEPAEVSLKRTILGYLGGRGHRHRWHKYLRLVGLLLAGAFAAEVLIIAAHWPFTGSRVIASLAASTQSDVQCREFHQTFLPLPGAVLEDVRFTRGRALLGEIHRLSITGSWGALLLLQHRLRQMQATDLRVSIPEPVPPPIKRPERTPVRVTEFIADGAHVQIARRRGEPLRFELGRFTAREIGRNSRIDFDTEIQLAAPPVKFASRGSFGPWASGSTPIRGTFQITGIDLGYWPGILGTLTARGTYRGPLREVSIAGTGESENFAVRSAMHPINIRAGFDTALNGLTGDLRIRQVRSTFLHTNLDVTGLISSSGGRAGKTAVLEVAAERCDIGDLLFLFSRRDPPKMRGPVSLKTRVELPPTNAPFLERVRLDGTFRVTHGTFTSRDTAAQVAKASARARGEKHPDDAEPVAAMLSGDVRARDGIASLTGLLFQVPGAEAHGSGTYNLLNQRVSIHGKVDMQATLSQAAGGGIKRILLKPLDPLFARKHRHGAVLPVSVTGTAASPQFRVF